MPECVLRTRPRRSARARVQSTVLEQDRSARSLLSTRDSRRPHLDASPRSKLDAPRWPYGPEGISVKPLARSASGRPSAPRSRRRSSTTGAMSRPSRTRTMRPKTMHDERTIRTRTPATSALSRGPETSVPACCSERAHGRVAGSAARSEAVSVRAAVPQARARYRAPAACVCCVPRPRHPPGGHGYRLREPRGRPRSLRARGMRQYRQELVYEKQVRRGRSSRAELSAASRRRLQAVHIDLLGLPAEAQRRHQRHRDLRAHGPKGRSGSTVTPPSVTPGHRTLDNSGCTAETFPGFVRFTPRAPAIATTARPAKSFSYSADTKGVGYPVRAARDRGISCASPASSGR